MAEAQARDFERLPGLPASQKDFVSEGNLQPLSCDINHWKLLARPVLGGGGGQGLTQGQSTN